MNVISFIALMIVRAIFLSLTVVIAGLGFIICAPFPSFWRELFTRGSVRYGKS